MKPIQHDINEELAVKLLGWKWMSFMGIPTKGTPGYPSKRTRVRQLLSRQQLEDQIWKRFLAENEATEATGEEPLSYAYCSFGCQPATVPMFHVFIEE